MPRKQSEFEKKLKKMNDDWNENKDAPIGAPDGQYKMQLQGCVIREAESTGNLYINREHLIIEGEFEGTVVYDMLLLSTPQGPQYVAKFIDQMSYEVPENATDIPDVLDSILNDAPVYIGKLKHSGDFTNVRIGEIITDESEKPEEKPKTIKASKKKTSSIEIGTMVKFTDTDEGEIIGELMENEKPDEHIVKDQDGNLWSVPGNEIEMTDALSSGEEEDKDLIELIALAQACDCEGINSDDDLANVVKKIADYEWDKDQLEKEEVNLLKRHGIKAK